MSTRNANQDEHGKASTEKAPSGSGSIGQKEDKVEETSETRVDLMRETSKVAGNPNYYEKDGLRTYGDDQDHDHEPPVSFHKRNTLRPFRPPLRISGSGADTSLVQMTVHRFMSFVAMAFLWTSAQIPAYLWGM